MLNTYKCKELIHSKGLKKAYVAQELGISPATLSKYILGRRRAPLEHVFKLSLVLKVDVVELIKDPNFIHTLTETRRLF
jgi:transcriptional regulator with XRE-family HTH domain